MWRQILLSLFVAAFVAGATGCRQQPVDRRVAQIAEKAQALADAGKPEDAVRLIKRAMGKDAYRNYQSHFIAQIVTIRLTANDVDGAEAEITLAAQENPEAAAAALRTVSSFFLERGNARPLGQWCERLAALKLTDRAMLDVAEVHLSSIPAESPFEDISTVFLSYVPKLSPPSQIRLADSLIQALIRSRQFDQANALLDLLAAQHDADEPWQALILVSKLDLLLARQSWTEADQLLRASEPRQSDEQFAGMLSRFLNAVNAAKQQTIAENTCLFVIRDVKEKPRSQETAAWAWINAAIRSGNGQQTLERLRELHKAELPTPALVRLAEAGYAVILQQGDATVGRGFSELCGSLLNSTTIQREVSSLKSMMLDACFLTEDFDQALHLLQSGIPGQDQRWHDVLINKVEAHKALKEGRTDDAVKRFRQFMEDVAAEKSDQQDPVTGLRLPKETILGLNWKRIGDILSAANRKDEAADAYAKARENYKTALERVQPGSEEYRKIEESLRSIP